MAALLLAAPLLSQEEQPSTVGSFIRVTSPLDDAGIRRIQRAARAILNRATREGKRPVLVFEIDAGTVRFTQAYELAEFISNELTGARTIAYLPKSLYGHGVMVALACSEIVMSPDAEIGRVGHSDQPVSPPQRAAYDELVRRRRNVPVALVLGMLDEQVTVLEVETDGGGTRYCLAEELDELRRQVGVADTRTIKEQGSPGVLSAREARRVGVADVLASTRAELAEVYGLPAQALVDNPMLGSDPNAVLIRVEGLITPMLHSFFQNRLQRARSEGAELIVIEIDSPGGFADASMAMGFLLRDLQDVHTVAYIPEKALSGAAFVALGCDEIIMHPDGRIGDAGPIVIGEDAAFRHAPAKIVSDLAVQIRELAEATHRPPALAEAMVDKDKEVFEVRNQKTGNTAFMSDLEIQSTDVPEDWVKERLVPESAKERFLEVTGRRAVELQLATDTVDGFQQLKDRYALETDPLVLDRTFVDSVVYILNHPWVTGALFVIGLVCLYVELHTPGFGLGGLGAGLCFLLFFWSRMLGGTAGWLEVLLFLAGIACVALEIFVVPGFGVTGVTGALLILASVVLASQTFVIPRTATDYSVLGSSLKVVGASALVFAVVAIVLGRYFHALPIFSRMVLRPPEPEELRDVRATEPERSGSYDWLMGREGVTTATLRPAGKARFGDHYVDVVAEGYFIPQGSKVRVIEVSGNRVVVKEV